MYTHDNRGRLRAARRRAIRSGRCARCAHDWIHWNWGRDIRESAIAPYLRSIKSGDTSLLICPADNPSVRLRDLGKSTTEGAYGFSYTMNFFMGDSMAVGEMSNLLSRMRNPAEKILLVEEDLSTVDDGSWYRRCGSWRTCSTSRTTAPA